MDVAEEFVIGLYQEVICRFCHINKGLRVMLVIFLVVSATLIRASRLEQELYEQDIEVILKTSITCDPDEVLFVPTDAKQWLCDRPFTPTAVAKNTKCFLTCNVGFGLVQEGQRTFHKCGNDGKWNKPNKVNQNCSPIFKFSTDNSLEHQVEELKNEIEHLWTEWDQVKQNRIDVIDNRKNISNNKLDINVITRNIAQLSNKTASLSMETADLKLETETLKTDVAILSDLIFAIEIDIKALEHNDTELLSKITTLEDGFEVLKQDFSLLNSTIHAFNYTIKNVKSDMTSLNQFIERIKSQVNELESEVGSLPIEENDQMQKDVKDLQSAINAIITSLMVTADYKSNDFKLFFKMYHTKMNYGDAKAKCEADGAYLATPRSDSENQLIIDLSGNTGADIWIGINDIEREGEFVSVDGNGISYTRWGDNEPTNHGGKNGEGEDGVEIDGNGKNKGKWNDYKISALNPFACFFRI